MVGEATGPDKVKAFRTFEPFVLKISYSFERASDTSWLLDMASLGLGHFYMRCSIAGAFNVCSSMKATLHKFEKKSTELTCFKALVTTPVQTSRMKYSLGRTRT